MAKHNVEKLRRQHYKAILYLVLVVVVAVVLELLILTSFNRKNLNKTSLVLLSQVVSIIEDNEQSESELVETLKEDYIIRAKTVSYILDSKPEAVQDVSELQKIAGMMRIDEIHIFDTTGTIYAGSEPKYYGYNFDSGEQMAYFKPMLQDRFLSMCQDVTPNTAEGKSMMYAITWNESGDKMIQIGIEPLRLLDELRRNEIPEVMANMPAYEGVNILVADAETGEICGATDADLLDKTLEETGITVKDAEPGTALSSVAYIDGYKNYCNYQRTGDYIVVTACSVNTSIKNFVVAIALEIVYLLLAGLVILYMFQRVLRANEEKDAQMAVLVSLSDIYNSMHLIDLKHDTMREYHARNEVSEVVNSAYGADVTMRQLMILTTEENYCGAALAFSEVRTMADRMQNKKMLSEEFVSKAIGWYRASIITVEADETGRPTKVLYVTQDIDQQKKKEEALVLKSHIDELTGLYNRRAYEDNIAETNDVATRKNFVFVSIDVNGLKKVNDTMGHVAGDELLVGAATCMKQCFWPYGRVYRVGGDEFAAMIYANETQLKNIKADFENTVAKWSGSLVKQLSVSCGYVTRQEVDTTSIHEIANIADKRMYEAKTAFYARNSR
jgi:diguanylate cyclase (GGDEF)-like protein